MVDRKIIRAQQKKAWRDKNKGHSKEYFKKYRKENIEKLRKYEKERYNRKRKEGLHHKIIKLIKEATLSNSQLDELISLSERKRTIMKSYSIEYLKEKFSDHAIKAEEGRQESVQTFVKNYPNEELPPHFKDEFNLPNALASICDEILKIKKQSTSGSSNRPRVPAIPDSETKGPVQVYLDSEDLPASNH